MPVSELILYLILALLVYPKLQSNVMALSITQAKKPIYMTYTDKESLRITDLCSTESGVPTGGEISQGKKTKF